MKNINPKIAIPVGIAAVLLLGLVGYSYYKNSIAKESESNGEDTVVSLEEEN